MTLYRVGVWPERGEGTLRRCDKLSLAADATSGRELGAGIAALDGRIGACHCGRGGKGGGSANGLSKTDSTITPYRAQYLHAVLDTWECFG